VFTLLPLVSLLPGVLISIISSIASNLGANVQKYSLMREALKPACERRSYILQKLWFIGAYPHTVPMNSVF
jgi:hypothetical protein